MIGISVTELVQSKPVTEISVCHSRGAVQSTSSAELSFRGDVPAWSPESIASRDRIRSDRRPPPLPCWGPLSLARQSGGRAMGFARAQPIGLTMAVTPLPPTALFNRQARSVKQPIFHDVDGGAAEITQ